MDSSYRLLAVEVYVTHKEKDLICHENGKFVDTIRLFYKVLGK